MGVCSGNRNPMAEKALGLCLSLYFMPLHTTFPLPGPGPPPPTPARLFSSRPQIITSTESATHLFSSGLVLRDFWRGTTETSHLLSTVQAYGNSWSAHGYSYCSHSTKTISGLEKVSERRCPNATWPKYLKSTFFCPLIHSLGCIYYRTLRMRDYGGKGGSYQAKGKRNRFCINAEVAIAPFSALYTLKSKFLAIAVRGQARCLIAASLFALVLSSHGHSCH